MICSKFGDDDFNSDVGRKSSGEDFPGIAVRISLTSTTVTGVMFESVTPMSWGSKVIGFGASGILRLFGRFSLCFST